ncbi:hypothetical protein CEXT_776741 [Caerostris extrusa]|uniref:Uncharacterized protein n=1 Tax=Caerostris extrusa TaxID=172846 RepID=A0AAV4WJM3_CAEEX|nr:hypothetical protein CEXT_776741 [Caerostris extrusa]
MEFRKVTFFAAENSLRAPSDRTREPYKPELFSYGRISGFYFRVGVAQYSSQFQSDLKSPLRKSTPRTQSLSPARVPGSIKSSPRTHPNGRRRHAPELASRISFSKSPLPLPFSNSSGVMSPGGEKRD